MRKAQRLRKLLKEKRLIRLVGAHNALSAQLVARHGFDGVWSSGFEISTAHGVPDANILTMTESFDVACEINNAVELPVVSDCNTGYGNVNNVIHMVKKYEKAGIAAVCIEDKKFPKISSLLSNGRQELSSTAEFVGKIMAAKNTQVSNDFMVIARVEALVAGWGQEEAIKRARAYVNAGADAILIHSRASYPDEIKEFCRRWKNRVPLVIIPTTYPMMTEAETKKLGIKIIIYANQGIRSAIKAMDETFAQIKKEKGIYNIQDRIVPLQFVLDIQGMAEIKKHEKQFLKTGQEPIHAVILTAGKPTCQDNLMPLLDDIPLAMLDIDGKSLLQRDVETLRRADIADISVVAGYLKEKIKLNGIQKVDNDNFEKTHVLESFMKAKSRLNTKTLLSYGDIIFDDMLLKMLIMQEDDITLVVDPSFKKINIRNKKLDLVRTKHKPLIDKRAISHKSNPVLEIGIKIPESKADYEFIGMILFSKKGIKDFKKEYHLAKKKYKKGPFQNAPSFAQADITDLFNEMIQKGHRINALEVNSGWMEIHNFESYKIASSIMRQERK